MISFHWDNEIGVWDLWVGIWLWKLNSWGNVWKVASFFVILGYESILCFELRFINFKIQNYLINFLKKKNKVYI